MIPGEFYFQELTEEAPDPSDGTAVPADQSFLAVAAQLTSTMVSFKDKSLQETGSSDVTGY